MLQNLEGGTFLRLTRCVKSLKISHSGLSGCHKILHSLFKCLHLKATAACAFFFGSYVSQKKKKDSFPLCGLVAH